MKILTCKQAAALRAILANELPGRKVRERMAKDGIKQSLPAFYILMDRMEDAGYLKGKMECKVVHGQTIRYKVYTITYAGKRALKTTLDFFNNLQ